MFDGGEHFHQFIASSTSSLPIPTLSFNPSFSAAFDSYAPPPHHPKNALISTNLALESDRSKDPWSNEEVLALLKLRSTMEIWFPDFTWEHVSRKLGELGFKRSGDECKEKFEEESSSHFHHHHNKNYRILSELDEFYHAHQHEQQPQPQPQPQPDEVDQVRVEQEGSRNAAEKSMDSKPATKKRKRRGGDKLEMLKGFCEAVVKTMMAKQEELHQKLLHDIIKRDEEKIAREEAWKIQEMDRFKAQIQIRSKEQKSAAERQATIIHFLKHFTCDQHQHLNTNNNNSTTPNSNSNSNSSASFCQNPTPSSPSSILAAKAPPDLGKRWPRDEVVALINLRCKMSNVNGQENSKEGSNSKGPLWERISQGMMEMGYKRNAKRCKEKWENINKYFRKTKDSSKKRSVNSRTCPYFHQLSCLYSDGTIVAPNQNHTAYMATATTHGPAS